MSRRVRRRPQPTHHVVQYSGGVGSWATAIRVREQRGLENLHLLFADTLIEDEDLYRFLIESAADIFEVPCPEDLVERSRNLPPVEDETLEEDRKREILAIAAETSSAIPHLHWIAEGRDPWTLFKDRSFLGNARVDLCSETLKRNLLRSWMEKNFSPRDTTAYIGIDWSEEHRFATALERWKPWHVEAPLCDPPLFAKQRFIDDLLARGVKQPRLYEMGYPHNNCGGFCVKAGMAHFKLLAQTQPERYAYHERKEQDLREHLGKDVAILRDRSKSAKDANDGKAKPLTLQGLRLRLIEGGEVDEFDWGGCGCAI